jgi:hypothetical protein
MMKGIRMEKVEYHGWDNCYRISNQSIELIATADVGPRIIRFGFVSEKNMLKEYPDQLGVTKSDEWLPFGGHRLWHAPESKPRTYFPDHEPVHVKIIDQGLILTQQPEPTTGIQKQIEIKIAPDKSEVYLTHRLFNHNLWAIETAPWAISVMAPGGVAILPLPPRGPHPENLLPNCSLSIWPYTNLSDPRYILGEQFILVKQDQRITTPQKIGIFSQNGWAAYANEGFLFIKQVPIRFDAIYPDMGANFEVFTNQTMLELESLAPIETIPPKGSIEHQEHWTLYKDVPNLKSEQDVIEFVAPKFI